MKKVISIVKLFFNTLALPFTLPFLCDTVTLGGLMKISSDKIDTLALLDDHSDDVAIDYHFNRTISFGRLWLLIFFTPQKEKYYEARKFIGLFTFVALWGYLVWYPILHLRTSIIRKYETSNANN